MTRTRFVTVTPLQLSENPKKYVPEEPTVNNIMRTFGRLRSMTEMKNSAGTGKLYEVHRLGTIPILDVVVYVPIQPNFRWRVTVEGR